MFHWDLRMQVPEVGWTLIYHNIILLGDLVVQVKKLCEETMVISWPFFKVGHRLQLLATFTVNKTVVFVL